jgi:hydrogenase maturation protein HypF
MRGAVQGIGLRPALFHLARKAGLNGWVQNRSGTVRLLLEGEPQQIERFMQGLAARLPPNARVDETVLLSDKPVADADRLSDFSIFDSSTSDRPALVIPADLAMCNACRREVLDPGNRRYGYPFTTCTACGPRYTVINGMPYDRDRTTLAPFSLCGACRREYEDIRDRRFHAESIACPTCGPQVTFRRTGNTPTPETGAQALRTARAALASDHIIAVRGIGGFLLAANAFSRKALETLRTRKHRPHKPFAVMARDVDTIRRFCSVPAAAVSLLTSPESPIVILETHPNTAGSPLPLDLLTPDAPTLGVMLPTSPLHLLLFEPLADDATPPFDLLLMTSGNRAGEPICIANEDAQCRLEGIADAYLFHDRDINLRNDDSVCVLQEDTPQVWRRARGYAPNPVLLPYALARPVLAMGAEIKSTIAVGFERNVVLSPHVGDLETPEACDGLAEVAATLPDFLDVRPETIAVDLHPDMHATQLGTRLAAERGIPLTRVQHHHAHAAACLAEHGCEAGLALALDGTGLGPDGAIWGAELLEVSTSGYRRLATFAPVPLPGGDAAVRQPARQVIARWHTAGLDVSPSWCQRLGLAESDVAVWRQQIDRHVNCPATHAAGRVFDAFAALLGLSPDTVTYEGQAPIRLEAAARQCKASHIPELPFATVEREQTLQVDWAPAFARLHDTAPGTADRALWALAVHEAIARACLHMIEYGFGLSSVRTVALTGGVFMNKILTNRIAAGLRARRIEVLLHRLTPPNDACVAFGQAVVAGGKR